MNPLEQDLSSHRHRQQDEKINFRYRYFHMAAVIFSLRL
jgi:hypothetical protein